MSQGDSQMSTMERPVEKPMTPPGELQDPSAMSVEELQAELAMIDQTRDAIKVKDGQPVEASFLQTSDEPSYSQDLAKLVTRAELLRAELAKRSGSEQQAPETTQAK